MESVTELADLVRRIVRDPDAMATKAGLFVLAAVFLAAAVGKLRAPRAFAAALVSFGITRRESVPSAIGIATVEVAVAVALVVPVTASVAVMVAGALLAVFSLLIARSVRRGDTFSCSCFGAGDAPISSRTLGRNFALLTGSAVVAGWTLQLDSQALPAAGTVSPASTAAAVVGIAILAAQLPTLFRLNFRWARNYRTLLAEKE